MPAVGRLCDPYPVSESTVGSQAHTSMRGFWAQLPREGKWLLSTTAIQLLGRGLTLPFTIIYLHEVRGIPLDVAGLLMAWIGVVGLVATGPGGAATDRFGARAVTMFGCLTQLVGVGVLAFATTVPMALVATTLMGITSITWPAFNALIASIIQGPMRQTYFGISFALVNLGIGLGGIVAGFYVDVHRPATFTTIYLVDAACMLIPLGLLLGPLRHTGRPVPRPPGEEGQRPASYRTILRDRSFLWLLLLTLVANIIGYGQLEAGMPAYARGVSEVSTRVIGLAFAANTAVIVLAQFTVLKRIQGHRRTRVVMVMAGIWAVAWLVFGATGFVAGSAYAVAGVILFEVIFGFGETLLQPTIPAMTNDSAPDHLRGRYNALSSGAFMSGSVIGPAFAGVLLARGWSGAYIGVLVAGCLLIGRLALLLERRVSPVVNGVPESAGDRAPVTRPG